MPRKRGGEEDAEDRRLGCGDDDDDDDDETSFLETSAEEIVLDRTAPWIPQRRGRSRGKARRRREGESVEAKRSE